VNPEVAHEHMAGLNFLHAVAQAWEAGKLFHIDLNDQNPGRYDQDFRFGAANIKAAFFLVKFLEDVGYDHPRHFDAHAYRTEDYDGVRDFARGCMRTYLILKEKAARWNADAEIQALLRETTSGEPLVSKYSVSGRDALLARHHGSAARRQVASANDVARRESMGLGSGPRPSACASHASCAFINSR
jgi:xylose isomerase